MPDFPSYLILLAVPLSQFFGAMLQSAGTDAFQSIKKVVRRRRKKSSDPSLVPIVLVDTESGAKITLNRDLPDEAYEALFALDLEQHRNQKLYYDTAERKWVAESNEEPE